MSEPTVFEVSQDRIDEVIQVLTGAFSEYETMRYMLGESGSQYLTRLRTLVGFFVGSRVASGSPILGMEIGPARELVAAALVDPPSLPPVAALDDLAASLGPDVAQRLHTFEAALSPLEPKFGFYYLGMIGVAEGHRGKGYARLIVEHIAGASATDRQSDGVLLTTEHEANVAYYASMRFETIGEATTSDGELKSWTLFRADA